MSGALILASDSPYRRELLQRLPWPFTVHSPNADETRRERESPVALAVRLARTKAEVVARAHPTAWVIGADQVAVCGGDILGKPGDAQRCIEQLSRASGQRVSFLTAVCLVRAADARRESHLDTTTVQFRRLTPSEIEGYVARERPFDCAGGFKVEGSGIALFECILSEDPTALIGLPLIWLSGALRRAGFELA